MISIQCFSFLLSMIVSCPISFIVYSTVRWGRRHWWTISTVVHKTNPTTNVAYYAVLGPWLFVESHICVGWVAYLCFIREWCWNIGEGKLQYFWKEPEWDDNHRDELKYITQPENMLISQSNTIPYTWLIRTR